MAFPQEKLVDFDNQEVLLQPSNHVAIFSPKTSKEPPEAAEAPEAGEQAEKPCATASENTETGNTEPQEKAEEGGGGREAANIATRQTFQSMGLRCAKKVAEHLLLENAYESNLLPDVSTVDYLEGNLGRTNLRPLEGLPPFVDDIFVFGYVSREECVFHRGQLCCTSGEEGAAKLVVRSISNALERALGKTKHIPVAIVHTVAVGQTKSSTLRSTIARIEKDTHCNANNKWGQTHPGKEIAGYFVAKCAVSEISLQTIHARLSVFEK